VTLLSFQTDFFTVPGLLRQFDAMAAAKMNTLHWHITDANSVIAAPTNKTKYSVEITATVTTVQIPTSDRMVASC
jgi:hypothetical protein